MQMSFPPSPALQFAAAKKKPKNDQPKNNKAEKTPAKPKAEQFVSSLPPEFQLSLTEKLIKVKLLNTKLMPTEALGGVKPLPGMGAIPHYPTVSKFPTHVEVTVPDAESQAKVLKALKDMDGFQDNPAYKPDSGIPQYLLNGIPVAMMLVPVNQTGDGFKASDV